MEQHVKMVGPVVRGLDPALAEAMITAIEIDNPDVDVTVEDEGGYIRIVTPQFCRLTQASLADAMGRDIKLFQIEPQLAGFAGRMKVTDDELVWWNTQMGLPHKPNSGKVLDVDKLLARRETWAGPVPDGTGALTFGGDVQDYRVEIEITAWGRDEESWSVQYHVIDGEFSDPLVRKKVDDFLLGTWYDQHGRPYRLDGGCIDSGGHHTQAVYEFCKARLGRNIWAIKGASERDGARNPVWPTKRPSRRTKASFRPVVIGGNAARDTIRGRLLLEPPPPGGARPGYCHFPADRDIGYFQQLTADRLVLVDNGTARDFDGSMDDYVAFILGKSAANDDAKPAAKSKDAKSARQEAAKARLALRAPLRPSALPPAKS